MQAERDGEDRVTVVVAVRKVPNAEENERVPERLQVGPGLMLCRVPSARTYGRWRVVDRIGGGGNGDVYRCVGTDGIEAAIKVLKRDRQRQRDRTSRFRNEVRFLISQGPRAGVVPLLDHSLPDDPAEPSWYVMPLAVPLLEALGGQPEFSRVVEAIEQVARTLADLAAEGVSHRDIKPDNLFRLNDEWAIGDFGLVKYPEREARTREGRPLGPYYFMAPEMRQNADTANAELADVYSLAKTLWAVAAGRPDPPLGELRRDRPELQLSSYMDDEGAGRLEALLVEALLERSTSHDPSRRPAMREFAEELAWWGKPEVAVQSDFSQYAEEVRRLRDACATTRKETERQRLERLYNEAGGHVYSGLAAPLIAQMEKTGLRLTGSPPKNIEGWPPENYGGGSQAPCWEVETLSSPWLAASIGVVHRAQPDEDLEDLAVTVFFARMTPNSQHTYLTEFQQFAPGSLRLDQIIAELKKRIDRALPGIIANFLTSVKQTGIPR